MKLCFTRRSQRDIESIFTYIAADNPTAAQEVENAIRVAALQLTLNPEIGVATDEPGVRRLPLVRYDYAIFYRIKEAEIAVLHVSHGRRLKSLNLPD